MLSESDGTTAWSPRDIVLGPGGETFAQPSAAPRRGAPGDRGSRRVRSVLQTAGFLAAPPKRVPYETP
jgi:hypothetical protein